MRILTLSVALAFVMSSTLFAQTGGYALQFDGTNDYVSVPHSSLLNFGTSTNFTIEAWIKLNGCTGDYAGIAVKGKLYAELSAWYGYQFVVVENKIAGEIFSPNGFLGTFNGLKGTTSLLDYKWHHVAMSVTRSTGNAKLYVDGKLEADVTNPDAIGGNLDNDAPMFIGTERDNNRFVNGLIDEVRVWNVARTEAEIKASMYKEIGTHSNLKAYYKMSDATGTTLTDNSGNSHTGTFNGPIWKISGAFAGPRQALDFDGINDVVVIGNGTPFCLTQGTIEAWIKTSDAGSGHRGIVVKQMAYGMFLYNNELVAYEWGGRGNISSGVLLNDNKWHHVAFSFHVGVTNGTCLYVDGVKKSTITFGMYNQTVGLGIGNGSITSLIQPFKGLIDEVRVWNTAKTERQIQESMMGSLVGNESNLLAYYRMDQKDGTTLYDQTANAYNGTLTNMDAATDWVSSSAFNTWIGSEGSAWSTAANWSAGAVPVVTDNVGVLSGKTVTVDVGSGLAFNLCNSGTLSVAPGKTLDISGNLFNLADSTGFAIQSDATGTGQLKVTGSASGNVSFERYMSGQKFHLFSPPLQGQSITRFLTNPANINISTGTRDGWVTTFRGLADYNPSVNNWNSYFINSTSGNLSSGKGYELRIKNSVAGTVKITGTVATSNQSVTVGTDWNCIGNPFASAIAANSNAQATNNILSQIGSSLNPSFASVYYWDGALSSSAYQVINNTTPEASAYIQAGQGFFLRMKNAGSVSLTTAMQKISSVAPFRSAGSDSWNVVKLSASADNKLSNTQICFNDDMTKGLDVTYDAGLFRIGNDLVIYTRLLDDNGVDFCLQALPNTSEAVPVGLDYPAGGKVIFTSPSFPDGYNVILEDRLLNLFAVLSKDSASYSVSVDKNTCGVGRFYLHTNKIANGIITTTDNAVSACISGGNLHIRGEVSGSAVAGIYSVSGKLIELIKLKPGHENRASFRYGLGVYVVKVQDGTSQSVCRVLAF